MFWKLKNFWEKYGFTILVVASVLFILLAWLFRTRKRKHGSYTRSYNDLYEDVRNENRLSGHTYYPSKGSTRKQGSRESKGEGICRVVMHKIFNKPFSKTRPGFLNNSVTGQNLELDLFNQDLMLAVEYNGEQHYKHVPFFHKTKDAFYNQKYRDEKKRAICKERGIKLIEVPYTVKPEQIEGHLRKECRKFGFRV